MRRAGIFIFILLSLTRLHAQEREEFNGPFAGWADVKKRFGAKGNGKDDDTKALQRAIDELSNPALNFNTGPEGYMVIYLPAGVYNISSTLVLKGKIGVSIIGEDPARTSIRWTGGDGDTLLWADGSAYFKIGRLTWDAGGKKDMEGIGIHWKDHYNDGKTRSFASLNIELSDNIFIGGFKYGISGGYGFNDSEIAIRRCIFNHCTTAAVYIQGFNALDYWIWDCQFLECASGVECHNGGYHVYRSFFSGSTLTDLHNYHGYYNSVRGCYSLHSRMFSADETVSSNPFKRIFQDNTVIDPETLPILYYHLGRLTLWGNKFTPVRDTGHIIVYTKSWAPGIYEVLSLHNTYPYDNPIKINVTPNRLYSFGDRKETFVTVSARAFLARMDALPHTVSRKVFEVPRGANTAVIQQLVDQAAALRGQRPIVHFGMGYYYIDKPVLVPAGSDMQLVGDGWLYASVLVRKPGAGTGPMIRVEGPSYITVRDLQLGMDGADDPSAGIRFENVDQPGSQAHLDQLYSHADTSVSLLGLDYLYVQKENSFFTDGSTVSGGPLVQKGGGTAGLYCYGGQFSGVRVTGNGRFLSKDCWWEGETRVPLNLEGEGTVCIDGAMIAPNHPDSTPTVRIGKFSGHIALMNMYLQGALLPMGAIPGLDLLAWNIHFYFKMDPLDFLRTGAGYQGAFLGLTAQCFTQGPECKEIITIPDRLQNIRDVNAFLDKETAFDRGSAPVLYKNLPAGISNISVSRISILGKRKNGIVFTARE